MPPREQRIKEKQFLSLSVHILFGMDEIDRIEQSSFVLT